MKTSILMFLVVSLSFAGCGKSPVGTYTNPRDPSSKLDLRSDGTFYLQEKDGRSHGHGHYRIDGNTMTLEAPNGSAAQGYIDGSTITDRDGDKWQKQSEKVKVDFPSQSEIDAQRLQNKKSNEKSWFLK